MLRFEKPETVKTVSIRFDRWGVHLGWIIGRHETKKRWSWKVVTTATTVEVPSLTAAKKWVKERFT